MAREGEPEGERTQDAMPLSNTRVLCMYDVCDRMGARARGGGPLLSSALRRSDRTVLVYNSCGDVTAAAIGDNCGEGWKVANANRCNDGRR